MGIAVYSIVLAQQDLCFLQCSMFYRQMHVKTMR